MKKGSKKVHQEALRPRITIDKPSPISTELWQAAKAAAEIKGVAASEWVFEAIQDKLLKESPGIISESLREKLAALDTAEKKGKK